MPRLGAFAVSKLSRDCQNKQKSWMLTLCGERLCFSQRCLCHRSHYFFDIAFACSFALSPYLYAALPSLPIMRDEQVAPCRWQANPYKDFTSLRNPFNVASRLINRPNPKPAWCQVWCSDLTCGRRNVSVVCLHVNTGLFVVDRLPAVEECLCRHMLHHLLLV